MHGDLYPGTFVTPPLIRICSADWIFSMIGNLVEVGRKYCKNRTESLFSVGGIRRDSRTFTNWVWAYEDVQVCADASTSEDPCCVTRTVVAVCLVQYLPFWCCWYYIPPGRKCERSESQRVRI